MKEPHLREHVQRDFLKFTARQIIFDLEKNHPQVLEKFYVGARDRKYQIWERNPLSIYCYTPAVLLQKLHYIHHNPVQDKWQLVRLPEEYAFSSARFYAGHPDSFGFLTHLQD